MDDDNFGLGDFLSSALSVGQQYLQGQNTVDTAKLQQQIAAQNASAAALNSTTMKNVILWGSVAVAGILVLVLVIKKLK